MTPRAHWKGYLKLSLVSCPIALYPAISAAERVAFRQVNRETGNRLRQQLVDSVTGEVVTSHDKGRGYEVGENQFLLVQDEELEAARQEARRRPSGAAQAATASPPNEEPIVRRGATSRRDDARQQEPRREEAPAVVTPPPAPVRVENNRTIEIEQFVPRAQIDPRYHDTPYYVAPRDEVGEEAFAVIRDAMRGKELVGMARVVLAKRERPFIVEPLGKGLCGMTLRYAHEVRNESEYFAGIPDLTLPDDLLNVAEHILESKTADFDSGFLEDRYRTVLVGRLKERQRELPKKTSKAAPSTRNVINLMDALKRSLETERPKPPAKSASRRSSETAKPGSRRPNSGPRKTG